MEERIIHAYMLFMWNADLRKEFQIIFDGEMSDNPHTLGKHIFKKWVAICEEEGRTSAAASLWPTLDMETRGKIVKRAIEKYGQELKLVVI